MAHGRNAIIGAAVQKVGRTSANPYRRSVTRDEAALRAAAATAKKMAAGEAVSAKAADSYQNLMAKLGIGTDNLLSGSTYGFNPITRIRTLLEWIYRGSWIGGNAVDCIADDMTREGVSIMGPLDPTDLKKIEDRIKILNIWPEINETVKWSRLYGGAIGVHMIDGQDYSTPLNVKTIGKNQYKGILPLDRWLVNPSLNDLVTEPGPHMGYPKYYDVMQFAPGLRGKRIHYSRVIRLVGIKLPYAQRVQELMWGESVIERIYDRMVMFDSATTGAAQLAYKSHVRTYAIENFRTMCASGGTAFQGLVRQIDMMRRFQGIEGMTIMDAGDKFEQHTSTAMTGMADILIHIGQQVSGALRIPLVILFGQSPAGLNSTGEADTRNYYDGVSNQQESDLHLGVHETYEMTARSVGVEPPDGFGVEFNPLWQLTEKEKAEISKADTDRVTSAVDGGLILPATGMRELVDNSKHTNRWKTITPEEIDEVENAQPAVPVSEKVEGQEVREGEEPGNPDKSAGGRKDGGGDS
jgi:phage-related protein (TIGR01555 family)